MNEQRGVVREFLKRYGMEYEGIDIKQGCRAFIEDMNAGLEGKDSSLKMIPTFISMDKEIPLGERVIVMDAGGTNFRLGVVYFNKDKKPVIENFVQYPMPGSRGEISKDEFYTSIIRFLEPLLDKSNKIGFCFSYAAEILPNKDGRLIQFSKEVRVNGLEGEVIGINLLNRIKEKGLDGDKRIVLINDTVATLLGGKASNLDRVFDSYIGYILGTGTNTCYIEQNSCISKIPGITSSYGSMLINVESGGYGKAPIGRIDVEFDNKTVNPGEYKFEKMISGGYMGSLMLAVIRKAAEDGVFSNKFLEGLNYIEEFTTREINDFLNYPYSDNKLTAHCSEENGMDDRIALYYLIDSIIERAARFVTINLSSIALKIMKGRNPCAPICITAEGSTFYKLKSFRNKLDYYMRKYLNEEEKIYYEFIQVENATLIGAAIAGLLS